MTKTELLKVLQDIGVKPSRKLGQNFLVDVNMLDAMVRDAAPVPGETVLEVGPGTGILTGRLLDAGCRVTAVEFDHRLAAYLARRFAGRADFTLIAGDACTVDYDAMLGEGPYRCIANLPYAVSSILITRLTALENRPTELFVLLQKEMARRLSAAPRSKDYGALSVQVQSLYEARIVRRLPPNVFFPPPEVESAFLQLCRRQDSPALPIPRDRFVAVVRKAFSQRRKQLLSSLGPVCSRRAVSDALAEIGARPDARPEEITPDAWVELAVNILTADRTG